MAFKRLPTVDMLTKIQHLPNWPILEAFDLDLRRVMPPILRLQIFFGWPVRSLTSSLERRPEN